MAFEILMMITTDTPQGSKAVPGESQVLIDQKDTDMNEGFAPGGFMEIESFTFGLSLMDADFGGTTTDAPGTEVLYDGKFKDFIQGVELLDDKKQKLSLDKVYPVTFDEISIERTVDRASPFLFSNCFSSKPLKRISIIKRKAAWVEGKEKIVTYLRLDFEDVLLTDISFSLSEARMKEDMRFVYRTLSVTYRPQGNEGSARPVLKTTPPLSMRKTTGSTSPGGRG